MTRSSWNVPSASEEVSIENDCESEGSWLSESMLLEEEMDDTR